MAAFLDLLDGLSLIQHFLDPVEGVPDLERLIGVDVTISNRTGGDEEMVGDLWVEIELDQFLISGREAVTRE